MIGVKQHISLKPFNTFHIDVKADVFCEVNSIEDIDQVFSSHSPLPKLVLGGGSNVLFISDFHGIILKNNIIGIQITGEDENHVYVRSGAGVVWHTLVLYCIEKNLAGIENLSLIPGLTGAGPMQNIGAYGVELKDVFHELEAYDIEQRKLRHFNKAECRFGYRESIFKKELKGKCIITSVTLKLNKNPVLNTSYGAIEQQLQRMGVVSPSIKEVSDAVISIRKSKLPDPAVLGNAGSFFKNPEIPLQLYEEVKLKHEGLVAYPASEGNMKIAAGWLIEQCGWKGKRVGNTGSHKDQALVLVNYGNATGKEIYHLALDIKDSVQQKFGITIDPEVNLIGEGA